jgi:hypothetical protein
MPTELERIKAARTDISNWVIHWTAELETLKQILQCGYLKPTWAHRYRTYPSLSTNSATIHGSYPAVCFTEQPLYSFIQSWLAVPSQYKPYGIAVEKLAVYRYGGRPVIYGDYSLQNRLSEEDKYLWVHYSPAHRPPSDWTHEREWRTKVQRDRFPDWGNTPEEGMPLVLPCVYVDNKLVIALPLPRILVKTLQEARQLREWIAGLPAYSGTNEYIKQLYTHFAEVKIIPLEFVRERIKARGANQSKWFKLETLPIDEIPLCSDSDSDIEGVV